MRPLGDSYVKSGMLVLPLSQPTYLSPWIHNIEFRRHREVTNPAHIIGFLSQWKMYLDQIPAGEHARNFSGKKLDPTVFEKVFSDSFFANSSAANNFLFAICLL